MSGGKDSTALYLLAQEHYGNNFLPVFADTGHEHPVTINYVKNLHVWTDGPPVSMAKAVFDRQLKNRRQMIISEINSLLKFGKRYKIPQLNSALYQSMLSFARRCRPTGNPYKDLLIWKGHAPSAIRQFCTEHLKLWPIFFFLSRHYPKSEYQWWMHTGLRAEESRKRAKKQPFAWNGFFDCMSVMPLLYESVETVFQILEQYGVPPNPLYALGYHRVGCFPCIYSNKEELSLLPDWAWERLREYESVMGRTWFPPDTLPQAFRPKDGVTKIDDVKRWSKTSRGGHQYSLWKSLEPVDAPSCMTGFVTCE